MNLENLVREWENVAIQAEEQERAKGLKTICIPFPDNKFYLQKKSG
jgi:hypothetical protein